MQGTRRSRVALALALGLAGCSTPGESLVEAGPADGRADRARADGSASCVHPKVSKSCASGWCAIPPGCFVMGSPSTEKCREQCWQAPCIPETAHEVTLTRGFEIAETEVTQSQFRALMGHNPSYFAGCGGSCPVEMVTWHEAAAYCNALSQQRGLERCYACGPAAGDGGVADGSRDARGAADGSPDAATSTEIRCAVAAAYSGTSAGSTLYDCPGYRLPTEAEWEYAYRAGTRSAYYSGAGSACTGSDPQAAAIGWYKANSGRVTHPVGTKLANAWGVSDMAGNVWEWCHDRFQRDLGAKAVRDPLGPATGDYRIDRGGSCWSEPQYLRAALRDTNAPTDRFDYLGFRCVRRR